MPLTKMEDSRKGESLVAEGAIFGILTLRCLWKMVKVSAKGWIYNSGIQERYWELSGYH